MPEGIQPQEVNEIPQETGEVSEAREQLNRASNDSNTYVEQTIDIKVSEAVQEAFVAVVEPVQALETPPAAQESAPDTGQNSGGKSDFGNQNTNPAENYASVNMTQGEVLVDNDWKEDPAQGGAAYSASRQAAGEARAQEIQQNEGQDSVPNVLAAQEGAGAAADVIADMVDEHDAVLDKAAEAPTLPDAELPAPPEGIDSPPYLDQDAASFKIESAADMVEDASDKLPGFSEAIEEANQNLREGQDPLPANEGAEDTQKGENPDSGAGQTVMAGAKPAEVRGFSDQDLDQELKSWEDQLNTIGDDAELADIDLQSALEKQQEMIDMLSKMGELQRDTAETMVRKMALGQTSAGDTTETGETGEGGENQIVIPARNSQIDFAGIVEEVSKIDSFTWKLSVVKDEVGEFRVPSLHPIEIEPLPDRTASGDYLETPADAVDLNLTEKQDLPAYDTDLKPEKAGESQPESSNQEASIREEISVLQDELADWPEGETHEITVSTWEEREDGTFVKAEKTVTLTKDEAKNLLGQLETSLNEADSRRLTEETESPFRMEEGSLLVAESTLAELAPDGSSVLDDLDFDFDDDQTDLSDLTDDQDSDDSGTGINLETNQELIENYNTTISSINEQILLLQNIYSTLNGDPAAFPVNLYFAEKQSDGTYKMAPEKTTVSYNLIPSIIQRMRMDIEIIQFGMSELGESPGASSGIAGGHSTSANPSSQDSSGDTHSSVDPDSPTTGNNSA